MSHDQTAPTTEFRLTNRARVPLLVSMFLILALGALQLLLSSSLHQVRPIAYCLFATGIVGSAYAIAFAVRSRFVFRDGSYRQQFALLTHQFSVADIDKIIAVDAIDYGTRSPAHLFIVGKLDRHLARLTDFTFQRPQMELLINDLVTRGVPIEHLQERLTVKQFDSRFPGVFYWWESHRGAFLLLTALAALLVFGTIGAVSIIPLFTR
ncbi:MAG: hypothetical protein ABIR17_12740 [Pseudolysinimonas sp.]|uniref:hypothetical protein n=1 Tax=Pseudolysinimonas sp. TaxID=2680009 RepID=UPI0032652964